MASSTFDPAWIRGEGGPYRLFYDGDCGLCHRAVRFILAEDPAGANFRFAPLASSAFRELPPSLRDDLPDSLVLVPLEGEPSVRVRSDAVIGILTSLGGIWRCLGFLLSWVPAPVRDAGYDAVARIRKRLFAKPPEACPILPPVLRERFDEG